jgi:hypothetical protein
MSDSPSSATLLKGIASMFVAGMAATVLFIMPAEFGRDPTGLGTLLGLTNLAATTPDEPVPLAMEGAFPAIVEDFDEYEPPLIGLPFANTGLDIEMQSDDLTIMLQPGEQVEYKAIMNRGDMLVYEWTSDATEIYSDFHADPTENVEAYPDRYFVRYAESEEPARARSSRPSPATTAGTGSTTTRSP